VTVGVGETSIVGLRVGEVVFEGTTPQADKIKEVIKRKIKGVEFIVL
jgi:hypothetical protein